MIKLTDLTRYSYYRDKHFNGIRFVMISERKLQPNEIPHQLYVQNYSTASSTCLCVRRWLFSIDRETTLPHGEQAAKFIFYQVNASN